MSSTEFKIKFDGEEHQIDADIFINNLVNITKLVQEANRSLDPNRRIKINLKAPEKSSFLVEIQLVDLVDIISTYATPENVIGGIISIVVGWFTIRKHLKGEKPDSTKQVKDNKVEIKNNSGTVIVIDNSVYNNYENNVIVKEALRSSFDAMAKDKSIEGFEILNKENKELFRADKDSFDSLSVNDIEGKKDEKRAISDRAFLTITNDKGPKWGFVYKNHKISANIEDSDFYIRIDNGEPFIKGDTLEVNIEVTQNWDESVGAWINDLSSYKIKKIIDHNKRQGEEDQPKLFN